MANGAELGTSRLITMHMSPIEQSPFLGAEAGNSSPEVSLRPSPDVLASQPDRAHRIGSIIRGVFVEEDTKP